MSYDHICVGIEDGGCLGTIDQHWHVCYEEEDGTLVYADHCCPECGCRQGEDSEPAPCEKEETR